MSPRTMEVAPMATTVATQETLEWLLARDPAIRWQTLADIVHATDDEVQSERARVEREGWGARLLALEDPNGLWDGGACFPGNYRGGEVVAAGFLDFSFPFYWRFDVLRGLDYFREAGVAPDPRLAEAVELVRSKQQPDGRWLLDSLHPGRVHFDLENVGEPSRWNTLRAVRVLDWWDAGR